MYIHLIPAICIYEKDLRASSSAHTQVFGRFINLLTYQFINMYILFYAYSIVLQYAHFNFYCASGRINGLAEL